MVKYLHPTDHNLRRITKADKDFVKRLDFKDIKYHAKTRGIHKIEGMNSIGISVFTYKNKEKHSIYVSKKFCEEKQVDLFLIGEEEKRKYVLIKDFNTFMDDHTLHRRRNIFAVIVHKLPIQKKYLKVILKIALKLMPNKGLRCLRK